MSHEAILRRVCLRAARTVKSDSRQTEPYRALRKAIRREAKGIAPEVYAVAAMMCDPSGGELVLRALSRLVAACDADERRSRPTTWRKAAQRVST